MIEDHGSIHGNLNGRKLVINGTKVHYSKHGGVFTCWIKRKHVNKWDLLKHGTKVTDQHGIDWEVIFDDNENFHFTNKDGGFNYVASFTDNLICKAYDFDLQKFVDHTHNNYDIVMINDIEIRD